MNNYFETDVVEGHPPELLMDDILLMSAENALRTTSLGQLIPENLINNVETNKTNKNLTNNIVAGTFLSDDNADPTVEQSTPIPGVGGFTQLGTHAEDKLEEIPTPCDAMGQINQMPEGRGNLESSLVTPPHTAVHQDPELVENSLLARTDNTHLNIVRVLITM